MNDIEQKIVDTILRHAKDLLEENWASIAEMLKEVPDGKINVGLTAAIDWSEAAPKVKTVISYSRKWKDEREDELDDPNQLNLDRLQVTTPGDLPLPASDDRPTDPELSPESDVEPEVAPAVPKPKRSKAKQSPVN